MTKKPEQLNIDNKVLNQLARCREIIESDPDILNRIQSMAEFRRIFGFDLFRPGNKKLRNSARVRFLIFNLPAVFTCPGATVNCTRLCYAKRIERYDTPRNFRYRNYLLSLESWFVKLAICEIRLRLKSAAMKKADYIFIRIHESGDFYSLEYVNKWIQIAAEFKADSRIFFGFYTKSFEFFAGLDLPRNMTPSASLWDDTPESDRLLIADLIRRGWQVYTADNASGIAARKAAGDKFHKCTCIDCGKCAFCYRPHPAVETVVEIH